MYNYKPHFVPSSIILIGAGGTGSRLMPGLSQLVRTCTTKFNPQAWIANLPIYVIDGDIVEEKNLMRQHFVAKDVGKNKAAVLANRYANAFGVPIFACTEFITLSGNITFIGADQLPSFNNSIVILAVDSADARRTILRNLLYRGPQSLYRTASTGARNIFVIDAGNEDAFGQIKFFTTNSVPTTFNQRKVDYVPKALSAPEDVDYIPIDLAYYNDLGGSASELSCVDLPQSLAINNMMAALICSTVQNFLYLKPMAYDGIRYALDGSIVTEWNTPRQWIRRCATNHSKTESDVGEFLYGCDTKEFKTLWKPVESTLVDYAAANLRVTISGDFESIPRPPKEEAVPEVQVSKEVPPLTPVKKPKKKVATSTADASTPESEGVTLNPIPVPPLPEGIPPLQPMTE